MRRRSIHPNIVNLPEPSGSNRERLAKHDRTWEEEGRDQQVKPSPPHDQLEEPPEQNKRTEFFTPHLCIQSFLSSPPIIQLLGTVPRQTNWVLVMDRWPVANLTVKLQTIFLRQL